MDDDSRIAATFSPQWGLAVGDTVYYLRFGDINGQNPQVVDFSFRKCASADAFDRYEAISITFLGHDTILRVGKALVMAVGDTDGHKLFWNSQNFALYFLGLVGDWMPHSDVHCPYRR